MSVGLHGLKFSGCAGVAWAREQARSMLLNAHSWCAQHDHAMWRLASAAVMAPCMQVVYSHGTTHTVMAPYSMAPYSIQHGTIQHTAWHNTACGAWHHTVMAPCIQVVSHLAPMLRALEPCWRLGAHCGMVHIDKNCLGPESVPQHALVPASSPAHPTGCFEVLKQLCLHHACY